MELVISLALGAWIFFGGWISYRSMKKEHESVTSVTDKEEGENNQ